MLLSTSINNWAFTWCMCVGVCLRKSAIKVGIKCERWWAHFAFSSHSLSDDSFEILMMKDNVNATHPQSSRRFRSSIKRICIASKDQGKESGAYSKENCNQYSTDSTISSSIIKKLSFFWQTPFTIYCCSISCTTGIIGFCYQTNYSRSLAICYWTGVIHEINSFSLFISTTFDMFLCSR